MKRVTSLALLAAVLGVGCTPARLAGGADPGLVDPNATRETRALFVNLQRLAREHVLFGHQDALAYGVHWINEPGRSDVRETAGSYPAVYGWEIGELEQGVAANLDEVNFQQMQG